MLRIALSAIRIQAVSATAAALLFARFSVANELVEADPPFNRKTNINAKDSIPDWPRSTEAPNGAPNIVVILLDDIGFSHAGTFGGPALTPEIDALAARGLTYNNFNTTAMCSPTRAALLTGRNHHRVGFGIITDNAAGFPGYNSVWNDSTASIAEVLRQHGYSTSAFGKWHNTPHWEITSTGPFDRWPTGRGFEHFYGFMNAEDNQWEPTTLYRNTLAVDAPATPQQGYHLTTDITNEAIRWVTRHKVRASDKPYFLYFATGAVHDPHHAPREWIDRYRGKFDQGWDHLNADVFQRQKQLGIIPKNTQLTPRPSEIPAWTSLSRDQKRLFARQMEVFSGFVSHTDHEVGRLLREVQSGPGGDNTLIIYIVGDNGAAGYWPVDGVTSGALTVAEQLRHLDQLGGPEVPFNMYSAGWAWAGSTPFKYWKTVASHFGGVRNPMVVSWPERIKNVKVVRSQFTHVTDVVATLYDVIGISPPSQVNGLAQQALDGVSFARTFSDVAAPSLHRIQYFEMAGNRAIYQDGWMASARHTQTDFSQDRWELYHVSEDFSQATDLAKRFPDRLRDLRALFDQEAKKNDVYPLGAAGSGGAPPNLIEGKRSFVFLSSEGRIPSANIPRMGITSYRIVADVVVPEAGASGILMTLGDRANGFAWYVKDNVMNYENKADYLRQKITSNAALPQGRVQLVYEFERDRTGDSSKNHWKPGASGTGRLYIDGKLVGENRLPLVQLFWGVLGDAALYVGRGAGSPVSDAFTQPYEFTGVLQKVTVEMQ